MLRNLFLVALTSCLCFADAQDRPPRGGFGGPPGGGRGGFGRFGDQPTGPRLNPEDLKFEDGVASIPDHKTYQKLSYKGDEVMIDTFLAGLEFVKFTLDKAETDERQLYFINTNTHRGHPMFARAAGLSRARGGDQMKGVLVYRPMLKAPSGQQGLYTFEFEPFDTWDFRHVKIAYDALIEKMPTLKGNLGYFPRERGIAAMERDRALYEKAGLPVYLEKDLINTDIVYLPLNAATGFGLLRIMTHDQRPGPRDVVIYQSLPNELPRVAGVMTEVRQTPLSHVNLRAVQDAVPNAFIADASQNPRIRPLIGKLVRYEVTSEGYDIREATADEVEAHFSKLRPSQPLIPERDLSVTDIRPLDEVGFSDSSSVGVKAANLATLRTLNFPAGTIPDGYAVPFFFYDEFMKHNGFYQRVADLLADPGFQSDRDKQEAELKALRDAIRKAPMPEWMLTKLQKLHDSWPAGTSLRCRSSTNNEDLPGFSGAGLYDSCTHKPDEGHLGKSIRQVYASMWNFRAFEERDFYRVDHLQAAMGVLVHPNYKGELANGVAVTDDILYQTQGNYYVNAQVGEDLVTNPGAESIPEELLLGWYDRDGKRVMQQSNQTADGKPVLSDEHLSLLRKYLATIHAGFAPLYGHRRDDVGFAMEIEFKITKDGQLVIKQARPWVFSTSTSTEN